MIAKKNCIPVIFSNVQEKGMLDILTFIKKNEKCPNAPSSKDHPWVVFKFDLGLLNAYKLMYFDKKISMEIRMAKCNLLDLMYIYYEIKTVMQVQFKRLYLIS